MYHVLQVNGPSLHLEVVAQHEHDRLATFTPPGWAGPVTWSCTGSAVILQVQPDGSCRVIPVSEGYAVIDAGNYHPTTQEALVAQTAVYVMPAGDIAIPTPEFRGLVIRERL